MHTFSSCTGSRHGLVPSYCPTCDGFLAHPSLAHPESFSGGQEKFGEKRLLAWVATCAVVMGANSPDYPLSPMFRPGAASSMLPSSLMFSRDGLSAGASHGRCRRSSSSMRAGRPSHNGGRQAASSIGAGRGAALKPSSSLHSNGSTGSTGEGSWSRSEKSARRSRRPLLRQA